MRPGNPTEPSELAGVPSIYLLEQWTRLERKAGLLAPTLALSLSLFDCLIVSEPRRPHTRPIQGWNSTAALLKSQMESYEMPRAP